MNAFLFLAILAVWLVGYQAQAMFLAFITTLALLHTAKEMQKEQNRHEEAEDRFVEEMSQPQVVTSGPVFPENASTNHLHFLEEPNSVGVFSYNPRTHSWSPVGEVPYPVGHQPEQVATIVLDKNV